MQRIVFVGSPSSGKSTLTTAVYTALKQRAVQAEIVYEWVRYDLHRHGPMRSIWEQYRTRQHQKEIEDAVPATIDYTIIDSGTLLPYFYAVLYADNRDQRQRIVLQDMFRYLLDDLYQRRYDKVFFLPFGGVPQDDGTRYQSAAEVGLLNAHMEMVFLQLFNVGNVVRLHGGVDHRVRQVLATLGVTAAAADPHDDMHADPHADLHADLHADPHGDAHDDLPFPTWHDMPAGSRGEYPQYPV